MLHLCRVHRFVFPYRENRHMDGLMWCTQRVCLGRESMLYYFWLIKQSELAISPARTSHGWLHITHRDWFRERDVTQPGGSMRAHVSLQRQLWVYCSNFTLDCLCVCFQRHLLPFCVCSCAFKCWYIHISLSVTLCSTVLSLARQWGCHAKW